MLNITLPQASTPLRLSVMEADETTSSSSVLSIVQAKSTSAPIYHAELPGCNCVYGSGLRLHIRRHKQLLPSAGVVGDLERISTSMTTVVTLPEPPFLNPPQLTFPSTPATPVTGMTSTSHDSPLPPYLASEFKTQ